MTGVESKAKHPHPQSNPEGLLETRLAHPRVSLPRGGGLERRRAAAIPGKPEVRSGGGRFSGPH